jgi:hypothetical protein
VAISSVIALPGLGVGDDDPLVEELPLTRFQNAGRTSSIFLWIQCRKGVDGSGRLVFSQN